MINLAILSFLNNHNLEYELKYGKKPSIKYTGTGKTYVSLLILDEWLLVPLTNNEARALLEIIEASHKELTLFLALNFHLPVDMERLVKELWLTLS